MLIIHITCTPLAGAPIRIVDAINEFSEYKARLINLNPNCYGERIFPEDLIWQKDRKECVELISRADILHFHHYIDVESVKNPFNINFKKLAENAKFIRHFHTDLPQICQWLNCMPSEILNDKYPKLVIPHYPERTFLDAYIVPNIIPINQQYYLPLNKNNKALNVFFSTSSDLHIWDSRWNTKGLPEVVKKFKNLKKKTKFNFNIIKNTPFVECLIKKQQSDIVIGDTTSGSYHLTDLEALSQGKPTFSYLDSRTQLILQNMFQCNDLPFINTRLEEIDIPFLEIVKNRQLREEIGVFSRNWIEKYYNPVNLIKFYKKAYEKVLNNEPLKRQGYLDFSKVKIFLYNDLYNMQWKMRIEKEYRQKLNYKMLMILQKIFFVKNKCKQKIFKILKNIKRIFTDKCNILFFVSGGIGDILIDLNYLYYLKNEINKNKAQITVVINREDVKLLEAFIGYDCNFIDYFYPKTYLDNLDKVFDITIGISSSYPDYNLNNKYIVRKLQKKLYKIAKDAILFKKHNPELFENFPKSIFNVNKKLLKQNKKRIQLPDFNDKLKIEDHFILPIPIKNENEILEKFKLKNCKYITINRGANPNSEEIYSPKMWDVEKYSVLSKMLKEKYPNIKLVQTGVSKEKCGIIENIDINLVGKTALMDMIIILKNSIVHIDGEGGMVHLKNALNGKSVVMFGPTDPRIYGYDENINIRNYDYCEDCCDWKDEQWLFKCIKTNGKSECMNRLSPEDVFKATCSLLDKIKI